MLRYLRQAGVDLDATTEGNDGRTAICTAAAEGNTGATVDDDAPKISKTATLALRGRSAADDRPGPDVVGSSSSGATDAPLCAVPWPRAAPMPTPLMSEPKRCTITRSYRPSAGMFCQTTKPPALPIATCGFFWWPPTLPKSGSSPPNLLKAA